VAGGDYGWRRAAMAVDGEKNNGMS